VEKRRPLRDPTDSEFAVSAVAVVVARVVIPATFNVPVAVIFVAMTLPAK
jgi:hypothetical protein